MRRSLLPRPMRKGTAFGTRRRAAPAVVGALAPSAPLRVSPGRWDGTRQGGGGLTGATGHGSGPLLGIRPLNIAKSQLALASDASGGLGSESGACCFMRGPHNDVTARNIGAMPNPSYLRDGGLEGTAI